jgi:peptidoglycan/xylan/chitin deacetylase (PgdA/CDA1 family)
VAGTADAVPEDTTPRVATSAGQGSLDAAARSDRQVWCPAGHLGLTFDDGPDVHTAEVLDTLADLQAPAVFFVEGAKVVERPDLVRRAADEGHEIANHTYDHERLTELTDQQIRDTVVDTHDAVVAAGVTPLELLRPTYGDTDARIAAAVGSVGYEHITWDVDSRDWEAPADEIVDNVLTQLHDGAVLLFHDGSSNTPATIAALPTIVEQARADGYCFRLLDGTGEVRTGPFDDVRVAAHRGAIAAAASAGVTQGCNPPVANLFCPTHDVNRQQMASFLDRALGLDAGGTDRFDDVDPGNVHHDAIERLAATGITRGCDPAGSSFCPLDDVTRAQVATMLARALGLEADGAPGFADVAPDAPHADEIAALAEAGITDGCDADGPRFCPTEPLTRAQLASLLDRADLL